MASPEYSITWPVPPAVPMTPISLSTMSLAVTFGCRVPWKSTLKVFGRTWRRVWVASTCSTSLVPMPNARQPKVLDVEPVGVGRDVVVHGREGQFGAANFAAGHAQSFEGLRAGDLVDEVAVDVEQDRSVIEGFDDVAVPEFFKKRFSHSGMKC